MGVVVVLPEQVKPQPGFDVVRDASFQEFCDKIRSMNVGVRGSSGVWGK